MAVSYKELYELLKIRYLLAKGALLAKDSAWILELIENDKLNLETDTIDP